MLAEIGPSPLELAASLACVVFAVGLAVAGPAVVLEWIERRLPRRKDGDS